MIPLEHLLCRVGGKGFLPVPRHDEVVLQRVGYVVRVREVKVFGHIHELKQPHVSRLSYLRSCLIQFLIQFFPNLSKCTIFENFPRSYGKRFCGFYGVDKIRSDASNFFLLRYQSKVIAAEKFHKSNQPTCICYFQKPTNAFIA